MKNEGGMTDCIIKCAAGDARDDVGDEAETKHGLARATMRRRRPRGRGC